MNAAWQTTALWLAQGGGVGRLPLAPGTWGSLVGLLWLVLLTATDNLWLFLGGTLLGLALSVWLGGVAERVLGQTDPGSVVLDEIAAMPVCFLPWVARVWFQHGALPSPDNFFASGNVSFTLILFVLFRVFDVLKPWPVRHSQRLPGGWGVTLDDLLAAGYVALIALVVFRWAGAPA